MVTAIIQEILYMLKIFVLLLLGASEKQLFVMNIISVPEKKQL